MIGERNLTHIAKLRISQRSVNDMDIIGMVLDAIYQDYSDLYDFFWSFERDEDTGIIKVKLRDYEHRNVPKVIETYRKKRYNIPVERDEDTILVDPNQSRDRNLFYYAE